MTAALWVLGYLAVIVLVLALFAGGARNDCNQNCNQGRACTCRPKKQNA